MIRLAKAAVALVALIVLVAALTLVLERAENATIDARFGLRGTQPVAGVAVVGVDERSFTELDTQWPFPRTLARADGRSAAQGRRAPDRLRRPVHGAV